MNDNQVQISQAFAGETGTKYEELTPRFFDVFVDIFLYKLQEFALLTSFRVPRFCVNYLQWFYLMDHLCAVCDFSHKICNTNSLHRSSSRATQATFKVVD